MLADERAQPIDVRRLDEMMIESGGL